MGIGTADTAIASDSYNNEIDKHKESGQGWSPGLVVMGRDSYSKGCGFESQRRILDGHDICSH